MTPQDGDIVVNGEDIVGYVCTTRFSESLRGQYGMALVNDACAIKGAGNRIMPGTGQASRQDIRRRSCHPHFYDPRRRTTENVSTRNEQPAPTRARFSFDCDAAEMTVYDGWDVVLEFADQGEGPWLVDLSHLQRWDFQHLELDSCRPFGMDVPAEPGQVNLQDKRLITRMNRTQATIWSSCQKRLI